MNNSIYSALNGNRNNQPMQILQQFNEFKKQMGNINPKQEVEKLLSNGQISQQQLNQAQETARQFQQMFNLVH